MLESLKLRIDKEYFNPGPLGLLVNPFYIARRGLYISIKEFGKNITGKTLDVGCGTKPYQRLFNHSEYIGLEIETGIDSEKKQADFYYDGKTIPFMNGEFDSIVTNQVLEHVFNPDEFLSEIKRVLKPGGRLLVTVPFVWDEHEQPFDFARYSSFGLKYLLEKNGFKIIESKKSINDFRAIIQLINGYIYKISHQNFLLKQLAQILLIFPFTITGILFAKIFPENNDLFLDNIFLAEKNQKQS